MAVFPAGIWEQDEAYFAAAVIELDVRANHPHPPWFPGWIGLGTLLELAGREPVDGLRVASAAIGVWTLFPLVALWSLVLQRRLAVAAAVAYLATPVAWLLAGRALTGTAATACLLLGAAWWLRREPTQTELVGGSVALGMLLAVRPQLLLPVGVLGVVMLVRCHAAPRRLAVVLPGATVCLVAYGGLVLAVGGFEPLEASLAEHAAYHFGQLGEVSQAFAASGIARGLLRPEIAGVWLALAGLGAVAAIRRKNAAARQLLGAVVVPVVLTVYGLSNPQHARYVLPLLAVTSGFVVAGVALVVRRWAEVLVAVAAGVSTVVVIPAASTYRTTESPPVRAVCVALDVALARGAVLVADRTLVSFIELEQLKARRPITVLYDDQIASGEVQAPPASLTVAVRDQARGPWAVRADRVRRYSCGEPVLRRLSQDRFMDLEVAVGAQLRGS